jgi:REP element-mobilizing transposase RayT
MQTRNLPNRKSIRLKGWDYSSPGLYFVTINTHHRKMHFGEIRDNVMGLSVPGCLAQYYWTQIPQEFNAVQLDEYIVMPNHIHGIIAITGRDAIHGIRNDEDVRGNDKDQGSDAMNRVPTDTDQTTELVGSSIHRDPDDKPPGGVTGKDNPMLYKNHLGRIIRWFKGRCTFEIRSKDYSDFAWQSKFYDHIIRNEKALHRIRKYIYDNPLKWQQDQDNPGRVHEEAVKYMEEE